MSWAGPSCRYLDRAKVACQLGPIPFNDNGTFELPAIPHKAIRRQDSHDWEVNTRPQRNWPQVTGDRATGTLQRHLWRGSSPDLPPVFVEKPDAEHCVLETRVRREGDLHLKSLS